MAARTSWNPRYERPSEYYDDDSYSADPAYDDLLDQGFDEYGRLTRRRTRRQPPLNYDDTPEIHERENRERMDLRHAVDSLARQVESMARQPGRAARPEPEPSPRPRPSLEREAHAERADAEARRTQATMKALDRLEGRLDAIQAEAEKRAAEATSQEDLERKLVELTDTERNRVEALMENHFAALEERIAALHDLARGKNVDTIRDDLSALNDRISGIAADGQSVFGTVDQVRQQLAELRQKLETDGWSGASAVSAMQDRLELITDKLAGLELTPSALSAVELGYNNILERVSRIEHLAGQSASADDLTSRLDGLREQIARLENRDGLGSLEYQVAALSDNVESLASQRGSNPALDRLELKLTDLARTIGTIRDRRDVHSGAIETRLADIAARIDKMAQDRGRIDFTPVERQIASLSGRIDKFGEDRKDVDLSGMERQLADLGGRIEEMLNRPDPEPEERTDFSHIETRLTKMQSRLEDLFTVADRSGDEKVPNAMLGTIDQRLATLNGRLDELALTTGNDPADLSPISSRLDAIDGRLDHLTNDRSNAAVPVELSILSSKLNLIDEQLRELAPTNPELPALVERLAEIDRRMSEIAEKQIDFSPVADQIAALEQRLVSSDPSQGFDLQPLSGRLERIEARLDAMSAGEPGAADRLADRLDAIDRRFDDLPPPADVDMSPLNEQLSAIDRQLRGISKASPEVTVDLSPLAEHLVSIDQYLRAMKGPGTEGVVDLSPVTRRLDQLDERLAGQSPGEFAGLGELRSMLGVLDERIANLSAMPMAAVGGATSGPDFSEVTERLADIDRRISALNIQSEAIDLSPVTDRLHKLDERILALDGKPSQVDMSPVTDRLQAIELRLEAYQASESPVNENLMPLLETLEGTLRKISSTDEISQLAEKVGGLHNALDSAGDGTAIDAMVELRNDITYLRRELRSMPMMAESDDGSGGLGSMLADIRERLDRIPVEQPVTFRDLEDQIGRIVRSIEAGGSGSGSGSLAQIESSLASIEARLENAGQMAVQAALAAMPEGAGGDGTAAIAALAASIEGSINELKYANSTADDDTRRTLDALNSTMEILVNRMSDLENATGHLSAAEVGDGQAGALAADPHMQDEAAGYDGAEIPEISITQETAENLPAASPIDEWDQKPSEEPDLDELSEPDPVEPALPETIAPAGAEAADPAGHQGAEEESFAAAEEQETKPFGSAAATAPSKTPESLHAAFAEPFTEPGELPETVREPSGDEEPQPDAGASVGAMLGRLTSSQILKRATGGRTDSFTPASEEDTGQQTEMPGLPKITMPAEPGRQTMAEAAADKTANGETADGDAGEPVRARQGAGLGSLIAASGLGLDTQHPDVQGNQFLSAARRAARAAVLESVSAEPASDGPKAREKRPKRKLGLTLVLVAALVAAAAFAGYKYWRGELDFGAIAFPSLGLGGFSFSQNGGGESNRPAVAAVATPDMPAKSISEADAAKLGAVISGAGDLEPITPSADITFGAPEVLPAATKQIGDALSTVIGTVTANLSSPAMVSGGGTVRDPDAVETTASLADPAAMTTELPAGSDAMPPAAGRLASIDPVAGAAETVAPLTPNEALPASIGTVGLRQAALAGIPEAQFEIASRFADGSGVTQDLAAAARWYEKAAAHGLAPAQYRLGSVYEKGRGVSADRAKAHRLYLEAAMAGNAKAMYNLAVLYADGGDGDPELVKAAEWFRKAAEHGVRDSQFNIGILYSRGLGVQQDQTEAYKWFAIAARSGDEQAGERRDSIANALEQDALAEALAAANIFQPIPLKPEANLVIEPKGGWASAAAEANPSPHELIVQVQALLAKHGFDPGPADGVMGARTSGAIEAFQLEAGLPVTGEPDLTLLSALKTAVN